MKNIEFKIILIILYSILLSVGCSEINMGVPIPHDKEVTKLSAVEKNKKVFKGKQAVIAGNYGGRCGGGCCNDFVLKDGINTIKVNFSDLKIPDFKLGHPIKVYGVIKTTKQNLYIQALGVEVIE